MRHVFVDAYLMVTSVTADAMIEYGIQVVMGLTGLSFSAPGSAWQKAYGWYGIFNETSIIKPKI